MKEGGGLTRTNPKSQHTRDFVLFFKFFIGLFNGENIDNPVYLNEGNDPFLGPEKAA